MVEFYFKYFPKSYKSKINQLIQDLEKLIILEGISFNEDNTIYFDEKYLQNLSKDKWDKINLLYRTLDRNQNKLSTILLKYINKDKVTKKLSFVDTFAGCGGLSLGVEQAGFNPSFVNEIEPRFLETYYFNRELPLENYFCGDIGELVNKFETYKNKLTDVDLFIGGPPCQGFSMANRQRILDDPRNELYRSYLDLLALCHPKFFIMENVKGMMNKSEEIKSNFLEKLGSDYSIEIIVINASDYGIAQNRERVFVIGSRVKSVTATLIVKDILKEKKKNGFKLKDVLDGLPILKPKRIKNSGKLENNDVGYKFRKYSYKNTSYEKYINFCTTDYLANHTNRYNNDRDIEIFSRLPQGSNSLHKSIEDIMPYKKRNHMFKDKYFKLSEDKICKTITSHMKLDCNMYIHPTQARGLSPRESARIQTFPDDYIFMGANNIWYAQIGNAVPVKLAYIIAKNISKHIG